MSSIVVVGGGIVGLLNAYELAKNGLDVTLVRDSTSIKSNEILPVKEPFDNIFREFKQTFEPSYEFLKWGTRQIFNHFNLPKNRILLKKLAQRSMKIYEELGVKVSKNGTLSLFSDEKHFQKHLENLKANDASEAIFSLTQNRDSLGLFSDFNGHCILNVDDCTIDVKRLIEILEKELFNMGVKVFDDELVSVEFDADKVSHMVFKGASFEADEFMLCDFNETAIYKMGLSFGVKKSRLYKISFLSQNLPEYPLFFVREGLSIIAEGENVKIYALGNEKSSVNEILNRVRDFTSTKELRELNMSFRDVVVGSKLPIFGRDSVYENLIFCFGFGAFELSSAASVAEILGKVVGNGLLNEQSDEILLYSGIL
ncbi:FAD-dependent oxidoreductase [Campylobacter mucosalis]|uniref:FAD-dependent oxidoreductase n=1 Tax=Campylobacter mucosalis TaxID=202 RepID=UPI0014708358|nr:FAD-dependent oxidoreductase [Campylobacter mucosalis]